MTPEPYVLLTLASSLLFASGNAMQKRGVPAWIAAVTVAALLRRPIAFVGALVRSPIWTVGLLVTLAALALETQALAAGDVSVVKPLSRIQGVFVLLIAVGLLGERLRTLEWVGLLALMLGAAVLVREPADAISFAPSSDASWLTAGSITAAAFLLVALTERRGRPARAELGLGLAAGLLFGLGDVLMKVATEIARDAGGRFDLASSAGLGALLGTPPFHLSLLSTAGAFLLQQTAFSRGRVSLVAPLVGTGATLVVLMSGALLLRESLGASRLLGAGIMIGATLLLSLPAPAPSVRRPA